MLSAPVERMSACVLNVAVLPMVSLVVTVKGRA